MPKIWNVQDMIFIGLSAYIVVWGINWGLRAANQPTLQA